ncbi:cytochrome P450 2J6-like [Cherax quadricarinatus]
MWTTVALVVTVLVFIFYKSSHRPSNFPPGPLVIPFLGHVVSIMIHSLPVAMMKLATKYGNIVSFKSLGEWTVLISDTELMRTTMADSAYADRMQLMLFNIRDQILLGKKWTQLGIIGTNGEVWKNQRRFTLRTLKDLGFGRRSIEPIITSELEELVEYFTQRQGQKLNIALLFNRSVVNVLWAMVIGKRFSHNDTRLHDLVDKVQNIARSFNIFHPALQFPWIHKVFPNLKVIKDIERCMKDLLAFIEEETAQHKKETGGADDLSSYLGAYQLEMKEAQREGRETPLTLPHLKANILELFMAGSETTSTTMSWAIYLMACNPEVQRRVQEELDQVVGRDNLPTFEHMDSLPYTTATIYEVQRIGNILPVGVPRQTSRDVTLQGYHIPKGTGVILNLSAAHRDPKYWKYPDRFYPQHFLTPEGKVLKPDSFLPFGFGKRVCLGESLARLELFSFMTTLMHRFSWRLSDDPRVFSKVNMIRMPPSYTVTATSRTDDSTITRKG